MSEHLRERIRLIERMIEDGDLRKALYAVRGLSSPIRHGLHNPLPRRAREALIKLERLCLLRIVLEQREV